MSWFVSRSSLSTGEWWKLSKLWFPPGFEGTSACWRLQCHPHTSESPKCLKLTWRKLRYPPCSYVNFAVHLKRNTNWNRLYPKKVLDLIGVLMAETSGHSGCKPQRDCHRWEPLLRDPPFPGWAAGSYPRDLNGLKCCSNQRAQLHSWKGHRSLSFRAKACGYPICAPNLPNHQWKVSEKSLSSLKDNFCRHDPNPFSQTQFFHCRTLTRAVFSPLFCSQLCSRHQDSRFQITFFIKRLHQGSCPTESSINSWPDSFCSALATMTLSMTKRMDCFTEAHHCLADVTDWISASRASQVLNFSCLWDPVRFCWQACCLQFYIFSTHAQSFWLLCQTWSCDVCIETKLN